MSLKFNELSKNDQDEVRKYRRFLGSQVRYGLVKMLKHRYWRRYVGLDN